MAGYGYHSYRGRSPKWKIFLAVVLLAVIAASAAVIRMQDYIVYDEHGTPQLALPQEESKPQEPQRPAASLVVEQTQPEPEPVVTTKQLLAAAPVLTGEQASALLAKAEQMDGVILPIKGLEGLVYFRADSAVVGAANAYDETAQALSAVISAADHSAARMTMFLDHQATMMDPRGMGLVNNSGYVFYDGNNRCWIDPRKEAARAYLCALTAEVAALGFDELILANVGYPTVGQLQDIRYGDLSPEEHVEGFLKELAAALEPYDVELTIEMSAKGILDGGEGGLELLTAARFAHRIAAPAATAGEAQTLAAAVAAAREETLFVPVFEVLPADYEGSAIVMEGAAQ